MFSTMIIIITIIIMTNLEEVLPEVDVEPLVEDIHYHDIMTS